MRRALFDNLYEYQNKLETVNQYLGYPDGNGTDTYCDAVPVKLDVSGKYPMPIIPEIAHLFEGCEIVESVEYPQEEGEE